NYISYRLSGKDETGAQKFLVGISHFLPGGGAEFSASPAEKFYYVLDGLITVKTEQEEITLRSGEGVYIGPDEGRSIINNTHLPASMLVAMSY
ncbi:unnamed protein product, partial [marine sediment metagenome]